LGKYANRHYAYPPNVQNFVRCCQIFPYKASKVEFSEVKAFFKGASFLLRLDRKILLVIRLRRTFVMKEIIVAKISCAL
jgi:hypothetical protein